MTQGMEIDLAPVMGAQEGDGGVPNGARLVAFTEAAMGNDDTALEVERQALRAVLSPRAFIDACATIGGFNTADRIADGTGIPLDERIIDRSTAVRAQLGLERFASSANTFENPAKPNDD